MSAQTTADYSVGTLSNGWRWLLIALLILIGFINPLLCVLHCALLAQHTGFERSGELGAGFYCDLTPPLPADLGPGPTKVLAGQAHSSTPRFFGGSEGLTANPGQLFTALALIAWAAARRSITLRPSPFPPPVPPPRFAQGAGAPARALDVSHT